ncbi:MAG: nicotinate (nicotinamide) nucleotide adenylyltransferase [Candidatus Aminicenantes bacterium]|nr:nicotinate (nicotinamide) nucleotide adenylyltransferase [Candidatus Aminicenantes bacterium]
MKDRVGLLGGTFNPVHLGHVDLGVKIQAAFSLQRVLYILSARPPHKEGTEIVPAPLRLRMLSEALASHPQLVPSDIEMKRHSYSWTYLTMNELRRIYPGDSFYFISGSEGFLKIRTWKNYKELLDTLSFIVVLRKAGHKEKVSNLLREEGVEPCFDMEVRAETPMIYIYTYESDKLFISSTLIRKRRKLSADIDLLVHPEVKKIILENRLYEERGI